MQTERIKQLNIKANGLDALGIIKLAWDEFASKITFATSLGEEDQVITAWRKIAKAMFQPRWSLVELDLSAATLWRN